MNDISPPRLEGDPRPDGDSLSPDPGAPEAAPSEPYPWDEDPPPEEEFGPDGRRVRVDAFTARRRHDFLAALVKAGTIEDACRIVGVGRRTVYRHQEADAAFRRHCEIAVRMREVPLELTAWERAIEGVEQPFACGGEVHVRRRYDAGLLRLLLQGANPKKYGPRPGFKRKRLLKFERKQMEKEIRAQVDKENEPWTFDQAMIELDKKLEFFVANQDREKLAKGWTQTPEGEWVPPGYEPIPCWVPPHRSGSQEADARDGTGNTGSDSAGEDRPPEGNTPPRTM